LTEVEKLKSGNTYSCSFFLPFEEEKISISAKIVDVSDQTYHCELVDLGDKDHEKIYLYVLERQKEELLSKSGL